MLIAVVIIRYFKYRLKVCVHLGSGYYFLPVIVRLELNRYCLTEKYQSFKRWIFNNTLR
jgi:hypothetical protein